MYYAPAEFVAQVKTVIKKNPKVKFDELLNLVPYSGYHDISHRDLVGKAVQTLLVSSEVVLDWNQALSVK